MGSMKKIVGLGLAGLIVLALAAGGTWAFITDSETSTTNRLAAGTIDLGITPSGSLTNTSLHPGATVGPYTIACANAGSLTGHVLSVISFDYSDSDSSPNPGLNMSAQDVARMLQVTALTWKGVSQLPLADGNGNGWLDLDDLKTYHSPYNLGVLNSGDSYNLQITLQMRGTANVTEDYRGDGVNVIFNFQLDQ